MALLIVQHESSVLGKAMETRILLPGDSTPPPVRGFPAVWLFHGRGESAETWLRHPHLGDLASRHGCALVMPTVANTRYADALEGDHNWTYISEELPKYLEPRLPLATDSDQRFAAGFSIGGLCALKLGIVHCDRFAAVCSVAGALNMDYQELLDGAADNPDRIRWLRRIYGSGPDFARPEDRLAERAEQAVKQGRRVPRILLRCGCRDGSCHLNRGAAERFASAGLSVRYEETDGDHNRDYLEQELESVFAFLIGGTD
jgi:S-formylglutathione hydrolase FrmB